MESKKVVLSVKETASYLGIGLNAAYALVHQVDFPSLRIGDKRIVIPLEALKEWLEHNAHKKTRI